MGAGIFSLFFSSPELIALGKMYCFIFAFSQLPSNLEMVASGAFKGVGKTIPPSVASITSNMIKPVLAYILSRTSLGLYGIWLGITITAIFRGLWICLWYIASNRKSQPQ
jgi:Na+-driven multidrug efflux pump